MARNGRPKVQFCPKGHDTYVTGRRKDNYACNMCVKDYKTRTKEQGRNAYLKHTYGITSADYEVMYLKQKGRCRICLNFRDRLYIDHNHQNDEVRELLCHNCNAALGLLLEDTASMGRMIDYVERHGAGQERAA